MPNPTESLLSKTGKIIGDLQALRHFSGTPHDFWQKFLEGAGQLTMAREAFLSVQKGEMQPWATHASWPSGRPPDPDLEPQIAWTAGPAHDKGIEIQRPQPGTSQSTRGDAWIGLKLEVGPDEPAASLVLRVQDAPIDILESSTLLMRLASDVPAAYSKERALSRASSDVVRFAEALDLMVLLNEDKRFIKAAMTFSNELASRFACSRVSVGWLVGGYARLQTMSHVEHFEERTSAVHVVEACMEEAADQDEEIVWPRAEGTRTITRAHEEYARNFGPGSLVTLPLRVDGQVVGSITCERAQGGFDEHEIAALRLLCDQATRRLADLKKADRWFGRRLLDSARDALGWVFGVSHTWWKVVGLLVGALFWFLALGHLPYRVEGTFILKTDDLLYLPSPFDGFIDKVEVQIGDAVTDGQLLLTLDTRELLLDETAAVADISRQSREQEKAMAKGALADMRIAEALEAQAKARLEKVRHNLENSRIKATMGGLIVEGDLKKMLGAPVRRGDVLFKIARVERMYADVAIDERDVHEVMSGGKGEVAFVSRPSVSFPLVVERLDPVAIQREGRNEFNVRARLVGEKADWWRPGMAGIAKLDCGDRNVAWIFTHRTIEFLRLLLWW